MLRIKSLAFAMLIIVGAVLVQPVQPTAQVIPGTPPPWAGTPTLPGGTPPPSGGTPTLPGGTPPPVSSGGGGGSGGPVVVQPPRGTQTTLTGNEQCVWSIGQAIHTGNTVVGFVHSATEPDGEERYPQSISDDAGNNYTLSAPVHWLPYTEDIGIWYLENVQGNPTTYTLTFPSDSGSVGCHVGLVEYSGRINAISFPIDDNVSSQPSLSITTNAPSLIWAFAATNPAINNASDLLTPGYSVLINVQQIAGMAVWGSNSVQAAGSYTLTWSNPNVNATVCADGSRTTTGCSAVMALVAIQ